MNICVVSGLRQKKQRESEQCETEVRSSETTERMLFHGIKWRHFDSVARSNIDWRTMGFSHGVMFGQGELIRLHIVWVYLDWYSLYLGNG